MLSMLGRFFVSVAFAVIYLYGTELFPTVIRTSTMGVGITFARAGNMIAPYLADVVSWIYLGVGDMISLNLADALSGLMSLPHEISLPDGCGDRVERTVLCFMELFPDLTPSFQLNLL